MFIKYIYILHEEEDDDKEKYEEGEGEEGENLLWCLPRKRNCLTFESTVSSVGH